MKLVEVIQAPRTASTVVEALASLSKRMGYRAIVTYDSPGFVVNHAGRAYVTEGLKLLAERTAEHWVLDTILRTCAGFRMGPFELLDLTGLDVSVPVMESIHAQYYGDDRYRPVVLARTRLLAGLLGRKSGQGFYSYNDHGAPPQSVPQSTAPLNESTLWWPTEGPAALPASIAALFPADKRTAAAHQADVVVLAPLGRDLSTATARPRTRSDQGDRRRPALRRTSRRYDDDLPRHRQCNHRRGASDLLRAIDSCFRHRGFAGVCGAACRCVHCQSRVRNGPARRCVAR